MTKGIVVEQLVSGVRFAISEKNFRPNRHRKIRDLRPGESIASYRPKQKQPYLDFPIDDDPNERKDQDGTNTMVTGDSN